MELDELQHALGGVVLDAAYLERMLRVAFSALIGSKYTAAIDGRMPAHTLIEDCYHIAKVRADVAEIERAAVIDALDACDAVNRKRNRVIHDAWLYKLRQATAANPATESSLGRESSSSVDQLRDLAGQIGKAADNLSAAVMAALGPESMRVEDQLQRELGHIGELGEVAQLADENNEGNGIR